MNILNSISGFLRDIVMVGVDAVLKIEEQITIKGLVFILWTLTVCYMMINEIPIMKSFGDLYMAVAAIYFGVGAYKYAKK